MFLSLLQFLLILFCVSDKVVSTNQSSFVSDMIIIKLRCIDVSLFFTRAFSGVKLVNSGVLVSIRESVALETRTVIV